MLFDPVTHTYSENGVVYTPVGDFLSQFKPVFQKEIIAGQMAKKNGRTADDIMAEWELNAEISCSYGDTIHKSIEYWIKFGQFHKLPYLEIAAQKFSEKYDRANLWSEQPVKRDDLLIAGTPDIIHRLGGNKLEILDIKTNGDLDKKAKGYFLAPLQDLPFTKINEYRLQLSAYKEMLELKGWKVVSLKLEHFKDNDFKTIELEPINLTPLWQTIKKN